jgi:hypothetical protein
MLATARFFFENLIDYAGMFPPARLSMPEALRQYMHLASTPESWMLGRFVCPAAQLDEFQAQVITAGISRPPNVAALGRGGRDAVEFANNLDADLKAIGGFRAEQGTAAAVDAMSCRYRCRLFCRSRSSSITFRRDCSPLACAPSSSRR